MIKFLLSRLGIVSSYRSELERYVSSHNPQTTYDVEQLTRRFEHTISRGKLL